MASIAQHMTRHRRRLADSGRWVLAVLLALVAAPTSAADSRCFGTPAQGRLEGGERLPLSGANYRAYSTLGWTIGRTHVHSQVRAILLEAFAALERSAPDVVWVYGETGLKQGGPFAPHKTHQNGLSVDLMVPVRREGTSVPIPGHAFNRFGYDLAFDDQGRYEDYRIDFEALGELIHQIDRAAKARRVGITRVIFEVPLQQLLWKSARGEALRRSVAFSTRPAWVRHDEHIHIDFAIACGRL
jgi:penicillin-insensitive murein endopeptidase